MDTSAQKVKELREKTGAGIMDCKRALSETNGDMEKAVESLRQKGLAAAEKRAGKAASEGAVYSYIHAGGKVGVLLEVNCETDFVAKTQGFLSIVKDIAMHIAALNPLYVRRQDVPEEVMLSEKRIYEAQAKASGKPENVIVKMAEGKLEKYLKEVCLLEQPFIKNPDTTVERLLVETIAKLGENISVRRFVRYRVGEGMEKKETDFAKEVATVQA